MGGIDVMPFNDDVRDDDLGEPSAPAWRWVFGAETTAAELQAITAREIERAISEFRDQIDADPGPLTPAGRAVVVAVAAQVIRQHTAASFATFHRRLQH
jgi:hypothetical protein